MFYCDSILLTKLFYLYRRHWGSFRCQNQFKQERIESKCTRTWGRENNLVYEEQQRGYQIPAGRQQFLKKKEWMMGCLGVISRNLDTL